MCEIVVAPFQSHCGAIKNPPAAGAPRGGWGFNPTVVRLKQGLGPNKAREVLRFNPTVVRLKAGPSRAGWV